MSVFGATQFVSHNNSSVTPWTVTVNTALGDLIIVGVSAVNSPSGVPTDTVGNTYVFDAAAGGTNGFGTRQFMYYCLGSIGANASNVISVAFGAGVSGVLQAWDVPLSGGTALFDVAKNGISNGATNPVTASFNTAGTDEYVAIGVCSQTLASNYTAGGSYTLDGATTGVGSISRWGGEHFIYNSAQTGITPGFTAASGDYSVTAMAIKANPTFSISGSASAGAVIAYSGAASGTATCDGSGNYSITNLSNGSYVVWVRTVANKSFSPNTSSQTISGANITGVNFTSTTSRFGVPVTTTGTVTTNKTCTATANTALHDLLYVTITQNSSTAPSSVTDTIGNTYTAVSGTPLQSPTTTAYELTYYCLSSIGANASNVVTATWVSNTDAGIAVTDVPVTAGFTVGFDTTATAANTSGTPTTASFNTANADSLVFVHLSSPAGTAATPSNGYTLDVSLIENTRTHGVTQIQYTAAQTGITASMLPTGGFAIRASVFYPVQNAWTISGNAGTCSATVSYSGTASGSVSANSSGDYSIPLLAAGTYTITPSKASYTFSPTNQSKTITNADITGVNFFQVLDQTTGITLTPVYFNSLTGANENPVDPTNLDPAGFHALQVLSNVGLATVNTDFCEAVYIGTPALGNDQYGSFTTHAWVAGADNEVYITLRDDGTSENCYALSLFDNNDGTATIEVDAFVGNVSVQSLYSNVAAALPAACDSFTLAVVGTSVALYKNNGQLFVGTSTKRSTGSASIALATPSPAPVSNLTITNMIFGNASGLLPPPVPPVTSATEFGMNNDFMF